MISLAHDTSTGTPLHSYQNMSKGIKVMEQKKDMSTDFCFRENNYIMKKMRVVSLVRDTPTGPLHSNQILSNYLKKYGSYGLHKFLTRFGR